LKSELLLKKIREKYKNYLNFLEEKIKSIVNEKILIPQFITQGKRLRALAFIIALKNHNLLNEITLNLAISIELLHASSLIHDDIIDNDEFRRESLTLNKSYGNTIAVLSGDYVFIKSLEFAKNYQNFLILEEFISTAKKMVKGEFLEEFLSIEEKLNENVYLDIIYNKTGSLFEYALACSEIVIKGNSYNLKNAGKMLGIAYQIIDDCEDLINDINKNKITLPLIYTYHYKSNVLNKLNDIEYIKRTIRESKAVEKTINLALYYLNEFEKAIDDNLKIEFEDYINYLKFRAFECNEQFS
jgi:octaprenyl-diphosphate synthase